MSLTDVGFLGTLGVNNAPVEKVFTPNVLSSLKLNSSKNNLLVAIDDRRNPFLYPTSIFVTPDETKLFVLSRGDNTAPFIASRNFGTLYCFNIPTPGSLDNITLDPTNRINISSNNPPNTSDLYAITLSVNGLHLYVGQRSGRCFHYTMTTPNDLTTATLTENLHISTNNIYSLEEITITPDGTSIIMTNGLQTIRKIDLVTPYTLEGYTVSDTTLNNIIFSDVRGLTFGNNGSLMYFIQHQNAQPGVIGNIIKQLPLSIPYTPSSVTSLTDVVEFTFPNLNLNPTFGNIVPVNRCRSIVVNNNGRRLYNLQSHANNNIDVLLQYDMRE